MEISSDSQHDEKILETTVSSEDPTNHLNITSTSDISSNNENSSSTNIDLKQQSELDSIERTASDNYFKEPIGNKDVSNTNQGSIQESVTVNNHNSFERQTNLDEKSDEFQTQHKMDDHEILQSSINSHNNTSFDEQNSNEVVSKTEFDDILGNKSLLKQTISPGTPNTRPARNCLAIVSYKLYIIDESTSDCRLVDTVTNESFFVGECDILPAVDLSVQLMNRGEHALIESDIRHCYGNIGCEEKQIPPISLNQTYRMKIDLELHDWKDGFDIQALSINERLSWSDKKRLKGNFFYRRKEYSSALQCYRGALKFLDTDENPLLEEEADLSLLIDRYIQVENNLAQVYLLSSQYEQCLDSVNKVLKYDSNNVKALFRQAKALFELGNYEQAIPSLKTFLDSSNNDVDKDKVYEMLNVCENRLAKYKKNEKEIYRRMFSSSSSLPSSSSSTTTDNKNLNKANNQKIDNKSSNNWWTYFAMGSAVLVAAGLAAIIKYR